MDLNTIYLERTINTLAASYKKVIDADKSSIDYDVYRCAAVKGFELVLEVAGKLLRRALKAYVGSPKEIDEMFYKDVFRHAAKHGLLTSEQVERWFAYRDHRNSTAHDYGEDFANQTLALIPAFLQDARTVLNRPLTLERFKRKGQVFYAFLSTRHQVIVAESIEVNLRERDFKNHA